MHITLLDKLFNGYVISEEKKNIYTFSSGWKNLVTVICLDKTGNKVRVDFRLAYEDVTKENLIDFIDFNELQALQNEYIDKYYIVYIGYFANNISDDKVYDRFIIGKRYKTIIHKYIKLENGSSLSELIKRQYSDEFGSLKPIAPAELLNESTTSPLRFGLRENGVEKKDLPLKPLVSIIIPSFNSESIIEQALQSAIYQTYDNKEIIIVDGGSKDGTASVVKRYEDKIDLFNSEPDKNIFDAINKGTYISKGKYSIFIGSDDLLMPDALENFVTVITENGECDYAYGNFINLHPGGKLTFLRTYIDSKHYGKFMIGHPAMFLSRNTFEEFNGFDIEYYICADADLELKLITKNKKGLKLEENICIFRGGGHSSFKMQNVKQVYQIFKKYKALNSGYYYFAFKMQLINIFILVFGKKVLGKVVSIYKRQK